MAATFASRLLGRFLTPQQVWVFRFFGPGPRGSGGPREAPEGPPWAFPGPPEASRGRPGPKTNESNKPRILKELIEQWRLGST